MTSDIRSILERMAAIESGITPVAVKKGLNAQQKSVDQLPALFRPRRIRALGAKTDPQHPMHGKLVGASESSELGQAMVAKAATDAGLPQIAATSIAKNWPNQDPKTAALPESRLAETIAEIEEDMLGKIKRDLTAYLDQLSDPVSDDGRRDRNTPELDKLSKKERIDRELVDRAKKAVANDPSEAMAEDPTQQELTVEPPTPPQQDPTLPESRLVRTLALDDGTVMEIHGSDHSGYEIRRGSRRMATRFPDLALAETVLSLYRARHRGHNSDTDYIEER